MGWRVVRWLRYEMEMGMDESVRWAEIVLCFVVYVERRERRLCLSHDGLELVCDFSKTNVGVQV